MERERERERVINIRKHKSEEIKGIKEKEKFNQKGIRGACMTKNNAF